MKKKEIITRINACVEKFGDTIEIFDIGTSVCIASIGEANQQAESFNVNSFEAFNYHNGNEESSQTILYKDLDKKNLKKIMVLLEGFIPEANEDNVCPECGGDLKSAMYDDNVGHGIHEETHCCNCEFIKD